MSWETLTLSPEHRAALMLSGISPEVAAARGYYTADRPEDVPAVFSAAQRKRVPALIVPVYGVDATSEPIGYRMRPDTPLVDRRGGGERTLKYEQPKGQTLRLDVPPSVQPTLADPAVPLVITEGEKKADAAASIGITCVSLPGVWGFRGTDPSTGGKVELPDLDRIAWNGRDVYVAFDSDVIDNKHVQLALSRLAGVLKRRQANVHVLRLPATGLGAKQGLDDLIKGGADWAALLTYVDGAYWESTQDERKIDTRLRDYILDEYELGQDEDGNGFALPRTGPRLVRMLYTGRPSLLMEAPVRFAESDPGKPVVPQRVVRDVMAHIEGLCYDMPRTKLHLRSAPLPEALWLDLGSPSGERVRITAEGWEIVPDSDVLFRRSENVRELPRPVKGGSLDELRELLNVTDETWPLVLGWLLASLFGDVPRPWLFHTGPQGSGKSDGALFVLSVVDPRPALQAPPRKGDRSDPEASAAATYLLGYDNMTTITQEHSDWLCALVTGAVNERRILHTTASTQTLSMQRSGILTGISVAGIRADLAERLVTVEFDRIKGSTRMAHGGLSARFAKAHGRILGALLDAIADVMRTLPSIDDSALDVPRMADYARVLKAYDTVHGTTLYDAYRSNVLDTFADRAEEDPVAAVVLSYMRDRPDTGDVTAADLHKDLSHHRDAMVTDGAIQVESYWPNDARRFGRDLRGLVATLEGRVSVDNSRANGVRKVRLRSLDSAINAIRGPLESDLMALPETASDLQVYPDSAISAINFDSTLISSANNKKDVTGELFHCFPLGDLQSDDLMALNDLEGASSQVSGPQHSAINFGELMALPPCLHDESSDRYGESTPEILRRCVGGEHVSLWITEG